MFSPDSRYAKSAVRNMQLPDGRVVAVVAPPVPNRAPLLGYHPMHAGDRLDLLAARYLDAPTGFWRLCDANNAMVADALAARTLIGIPRTGAT